MNGDGVGPVDPDLADARVGKLIKRTGSPLADSLVHHLVSLDVPEWERMRRRQKLYLARHGRISVFEWEHREVTELNLYYTDLSEMIAAQGGDNPIAEAIEDET